MAELLEQIKQLTPFQQLELIREIALNLEEQAEHGLSPEQQAELEESSRMAHLNPRDGSDWPTVRARVLASASAPS